MSQAKMRRKYQRESLRCSVSMIETRDGGILGGDAPNGHFQQATPRTLKRELSLAPGETVAEGVESFQSGQDEDEKLVAERRKPECEKVGRDVEWDACFVWD
jgi:hypothetical protein